MQSGCVGVLAVFSIGDMIVYNRRKRAIYFAAQERDQALILASAREAVASGTASPAQTALVVGIAEEEEAMEKKKAERKAPSKLLWWLHGDWKEEKLLEEQRRAALAEFKRIEAVGAGELGKWRGDLGGRGDVRYDVQLWTRMTEIPYPVPQLRHAPLLFFHGGETTMYSLRTQRTASPQLEYSTQRTLFPSFCSACLPPRSQMFSSTPALGTSVTTPS